MFLKSLEIFGFKSFADRTHINFADGITALLGPNGCGKSNVVDAIKWVLAENRSKNLRAESMEDVIFNGTETRPALSMAEVTLTIANENGLLPLEDSEIAIKRRLYRNGENEYFINSNQVGASSIRKLFMDTGVGKAAYSVMEQGKIDQILSSKPEDRRYLFEEAAGISRSKAEVADAERELEKTRANLAQIDIGLAETKRSYETLKVQAEKTAKYRKLQDEKFECELDIQLLKLKDFTQNKARHEQNRKEAEEKRNSAANEIEEILNTLQVNTDKVKELQEQVNTKQQLVIKISAEQTGKKAMARQLHEHQSQMKEKIGQIENRIKNIEERIDEYNEEIDSQNAELHEKHKQLSDINKNVENFSENIRQSSSQIEENLRLINTNSGKINNLDSERVELQKQLTSITEDIVTELDAKLKDAGYSSTSNKKAKEALDTALEKIKIYANGRANIFKDFSSLPSHSEKDSAQMGSDAVAAFTEILRMLEELSQSISEYTKTTPQFIDDFLSPEGIITKKRGIDSSIQQNLSTIDSIKNESAELNSKNNALNKKIDEYKDTLSKLRINQAQMAQQITSCEQQISTLRKTLASEETSLREQQNELFEENKRREENEEQLQETEESIAELEAQGQKITAELNDLDKQISECNSQVSGKQNALQKKQEERNKYQSQLEKFSVGIAQYDTEIRNVKQNFQENFSRDLMEFEERMYTITTPVPALKEKLSQVKQKIQELGTPNLMAIEQFAEEKERYERQQANYNDTQKTLENLVRVSEEIRTKSSEMFLDTYNKIRKNFHNMFRRLMNGGRAELRLVDPANVLSSGVEILAQPPGKKLVNISLLSGGEKTMTAVALLFATYQVRPSPFCLLDEIDAALDDKNVASFVSTLRAFGNISQYIVITHNRKTVMGASTMLGVTMEESGITKVLQVRLDEDTMNGNIVFNDQSDFVEEEVPQEEGIVIPPRPPRREHNPDGTLKTDGKTETEETRSQQ
ncbi:MULTISPECIES: chromosome segregation SMC family protein [Treponema]|uniref:Chromosome partition protein Smc n=3 Tax=Treponema TaxID=157 RepID=F2NRX4_TRES6|nr:MULTISPECIES: AAA family ATPase [Treponema]AEB14210.1 chromosome segregation protein SMC [Treponema succinifaciens DSM 2489]MCI6912225.1 AAA family ATPase [Treponema succinifaciens]MDD6963183.1 AAA family ATPase [Treponema succinifaciens]MDY5117945.1 AAA family ATPase [Treponema succinifaciens]